MCLPLIPSIQFLLVFHSFDMQAHLELEALGFSFFSFSSYMSSPTCFKLLQLVPHCPLKLWSGNRPYAAGWWLRWDGTVGSFNSVPRRKAWSSSSLGPQLPRKLSPWAALGRRVFSFLSGLRVTPPKVDSKQRSTVSPSFAVAVRVEPPDAASFQT